MLARGAFVFSLDLELAWGTRGRPKAAVIGPFVDGTRGAVAQLLNLFDQYEVSATWATVGALLMGAAGVSQKHRWLDDERFADIPVGDFRTAPRWYAEDLIEQIRECRAFQEIGCHTLTHVLIDASPRSREVLAAELDRFRELFGELGLPQPVTFIYPKGRMAHFDVLAEKGFRCYRGPENKWFEGWPSESLRAAIRLLDARLAVAPRVVQPRKTSVGLWEIPSSQFYSPFLGVGKRVSVSARVRKAIKGLRLAAENGGVFHLWTHPNNLGVRTSELLQGLEDILKVASRLREQGMLDNWTMGEMALALDHRSMGNSESSLPPSGIGAAGRSCREEGITRSA